MTETTLQLIYFTGGSWSWKKSGSIWFCRTHSNRNNMGYVFLFVIEKDM